jgi:hypothetical protein
MSAGASEHGHSRQPRVDLLEKLDVLGRDLPERHAQACHVCAWSRQAGHEPLVHGIGDVHHDDRRALRDLAGGSRGLIADRDDDIGVSPNELLHRLRKAVVANAHACHIDRDVPAHDISGLCEAREERLVPNADGVGKVRAAAGT